MFVRSRLQSLADPFAHSWILDVHEFRTDGVGINSLQAGHHLPHRHGAVIKEKF